MNDHHKTDNVRLQRLMEDSPEEVPDRRLHHQFQQMLREQRSADQQAASTKAERLTITPWLNVAAAIVLIAVGISIGRFWTHETQSTEEVAALHQEIEETKALLQQVVDGNLSASQRLRRVRASDQLENIDPDIRDVLVRTMNTDGNVNVRIAATKALSSFTDDPAVRTALVQSLTTQEDPFVQLMLIHVLVRIGEDQAIPQLKKILRDASVDQSVQDEAQRGIFQLS